MMSGDLRFTNSDLRLWIRNYVEQKIQNPKPARRNFRGYTLIEILIVVTILGISGVLVIPHMVGRDIMNAESAVRLLIGDLSFAQSDALAHQEYRRVHFYDDGRGYCITRITEAEIGSVFDEATADYIQDPLARSSSQGNYIVDYIVDDRFTGVEIESADIDGGERDIYYDPIGGTVMDGGVPGTGGTIVVAMDDERYEITISPFTGKLSVLKL